MNVITGTEVIAQGGGTRPPEGLLLNVYEDLTGGLVTAVVEAVNDGNDEETFSDGSTVVVKNHDLEPGSRWPHNEFLWEDGPIAEFPLGFESTINPPPWQHPPKGRPPRRLEVVREQAATAIGVVR